MHITAHSAQGPVSEMTYTMSSGTLNPSVPYHTIKWGHRNTKHREFDLLKAMCSFIFMFKK